MEKLIVDDQQAEVMMDDQNDRFAEELRAFCGDAALLVLGLESRLRALVAAAERRPQLVLLEEAIGSTLQIAKSLLDAGQHGHHGRLLALRPLLRALSLTTVRETRLPPALAETPSDAATAS